MCPLKQDNEFWEKNARFVGEIFAPAFAKIVPFFGSKVPAVKNLARRQQAAVKSAIDMLQGYMHRIYTRLELHLQRP
jgi:hypothetical protein